MDSYPKAKAPNEPRGNNREFNWMAHEYVYYEKSSNWYWILGIVTITLVIIAFLLNNLLFAIFILLAGGTLVLYGSKKPEILQFSATTTGVKVKNFLYPYQTLDFFWIDETGLEPILILEPKKRVSNQILIPLGDTEPQALREFLDAYIPEDYIERTWAQKIMEEVGF
jgi:hypothetical protein